MHYRRDIDGYNSYYSMYCEPVGATTYKCEIYNPDGSLGEQGKIWFWDVKHREMKFDSEWTDKGYLADIWCYSEEDFITAVDHFADMFFVE